jgi:hypothetical protein
VAGRLTGMAQAMKEQVRRARLREYEAALEGARSQVGVMLLFAQGLEIRAAGEALEEAFAATPVEGVEDAHRLPAAVWVTLRQGDVDATIDALIRVSHKEFVIDTHEELDVGYRLTTVEERRTLPDVELLEAQVAAFLQVPCDVVVIIAGWGPEHPRTAAEIGTLLDQRFGSAVASESNSAPVSANGSRTAADADDTFLDQRSESAAPSESNSVVVLVSGPRTGLVMSSTEFTAMLNLSLEQRAVLGTLVRQADITIISGG